jgi:outer membrane protein
VYLKFKKRFNKSDNFTGSNNPYTGIRRKNMHAESRNRWQRSISITYSTLINVRMKNTLLLTVFFLSTLLFMIPNALFCSEIGASDSLVNPKSDQPETVKKLTLGECIDLALKNNKTRKISKASLDIAEAQYGQALSSFWPQLSLKSTATRMESAPLFVFPSQPLPLGAAASPFAEAIATAQLAKVGITPTTAPGGLAGYNAALSGTTATVMQGLQNTSLAEQRIKLMDRDNLSTTLEMIYPLYTGGKRSSVVEQARLGTQIARESARRTDIQVISDVKKYYYGSIIAKQALQMGQETNEKFNVTLELTESLYKNGTGKVKKTDYLRAQVMAYSIKAAMESLKSSDVLARSALGNAIGLDWHTDVEPATNEIPLDELGSDFETLVSDAQKWNPLVIQVQHATGITEAKIREAKSGHLPIVALFGQINRIDNSYDAGMVPNENKKNWLLGLRMELPLFMGFRTVNEEKEASAHLEKIRQESFLLKEGLALQVKNAFLQVGRSLAQVKATKDALTSAFENQDLNMRAYQDELVETKDVIEAQMISFFVHGQHLKAIFDYVTNRNDLELVVGKSISESSTK